MTASSNRFSIRKNFITLLLVTMGGGVLLCWLLFMFLAFVSKAPIFQDEHQRSLDIFMVFIFPFILAVIVMVASLILAAILRQKWWIAAPLSILLLGAPLVAYVVVWLASWIARLFYIPTPEDEERTNRFFSMSIVQKAEPPDADIAQIRKMKTLLDEGVITSDEFTLQKQKVFTNINEEITKRNVPRYFSIWQAVAAAAFGGFAAGALLIALNFKKLKREDQFRGSLLIVFIGLIVSATLNVLISTLVSNLPVWFNISLTATYPILIYLWYNETIRNDIGELVAKEQARNESWWLAAGLSLVAFVLLFFTLIPIFALVAYFRPA